MWVSLGRAEPPARRTSIGSVQTSNFAWPLVPKTYTTGTFSARERILIIGHGLKDIGGKESFVIVLPRTMAGDLLSDMQRSFDQKWAKGTPL
jgi:hypothetical protein